MEIPAPPPPRRYPLGNPACSTSQAAGTFTPPSAGNEGMSFHCCASSAKAAAGSTGFVKNEPAELRHGALQLRIADARPLVASEAQRDLEHDVPPSVLALEAAVAIAEGAVLRAERPALERRAIEAFDAHQRLGDLLSVRAHVLDRRAAHRPWNARQALDPGPAALHHVLHQLVPIDPSASTDLGAGPVMQLHPADCDAQDESGEP